MHMIGISGRCSAEHRAYRGLYPFPFEARARRGCASISASKTGCQWCRALVSETPLSMAWAYLMVVSRPGPTRATGAGPGTEISRGLRICGRGARRIPSSEMGLVSMGGAEAAARLLRTLSETRDGSVPDHRDPRPGPRALGRPGVRESVGEGIRLRAQSCGHRRRHGLQRGPLRDRGTPPLEGGPRFHVPGSRPRILRDSGLGLLRDLLPQRGVVRPVSFHLRRTAERGMGRVRLVRRRSSRLDTVRLPAISARSIEAFREDVTSFDATPRGSFRKRAATD